MKDKNHRRRLKKKAAAEAAAAQQAKRDVKHEESRTNITDKDERSDKVILLARKYEWINENDPLYDMYQNVTSSLKRSHQNTLAPIEETTQDYTASTGGPQAEEVNDSASTINAQSMSKRQSRLLNKPNLADLKLLSQRPELIEWYDADAPHPEFQVKMKSQTFVVPVPENWRSNDGIPTFGPKPPYEVPDSVKAIKLDEWGIGQSQVGNSTNSQSSTVKSAIAAGNIDYELLHSAFFGPDAHFPESNFLSFCEVVDAKLTRQFSAVPSKNTGIGADTKTPPREVSSRLREALGIGSADALPWQPYIDENGLAPGYAKSLQDPGIQLWGEL